MDDPAGEDLVSTCSICGTEIRAVLEPGRGTVEVMRAARTATERHLRSYTAAELARAKLRQILPKLPPAQRIELVKRIYTDLLRQWGDQDRRGVYAIDEALGSLGVYRFWQTANDCGVPHCRHLP